MVWDGLAPYLLDKASEEEIRRSAPANDYGYQKRQLLLTWKRMRGENATYGELITALCRAENVELAGKVKVLVLQESQRSKDPPESDVLPSVLQTFRAGTLDRLL